MRTAPRRPPTIVDVARRAGVSKSLVSIVLRGDRYVSDERRRAVLKAAEESGYRPNAVAATLAGRRSRVLGVLASDLHNPFFPEVTDGIQEAAAIAGYRTLLGSGNRRSLHEQQVVDAMLELRVDGLILLSPNLAAKALQDVRNAAPLTVVGRRPAGLSRVDTVMSDDRMGAFLAVEHLVNAGHRRIAHIAGGRRSGAHGRRRGYEEAMAHFGIAHEVSVAAGDYTTDKGGFSAARQLLDAPNPPTAIFTVNDLAAAGAVGAARSLGWQVPSDLSIVGYDNTSLAAMHHLALTTVDQPRFEMGAQAVAILERRIVGDQERRAEHIVLAPKLVVRDSVARPRLA